jgi:tRNA A-37 threonylcarbamoyl transferase component Bud32
MRGVLLGCGRSAEVYAWNDKALKLFRDGISAERARAEAKVARAAHRAGLSVPAVSEVVEIDGRIGIVYERVDGVTMLQTFATRP